jgi:glycosyltransferase involved in cell wall biosynthesis
MTAPKVSVVMGVFNSAPTLAATLDSILKQERVDLEFVVVDDGSTDQSGEILSSYASRDSRLIVLRQENKGLTSALIRGCAHARGEFIARQDAGGDISLLGRLAHQVEFLGAHPEAVMTACGTHVVDLEGESLYEIRQTEREFQDALFALDDIKGPSHHGAVMFRREAYEKVGGYRKIFAVAQDLDLWSRLVEVGECLSTTEVLYQTQISYGSITHLNRGLQKRVSEIIARCALARRQGREDAELLQNVQALQPASCRNGLARLVRDAHFYYFLGSMLRTKEPGRARKYFLKALACWPIYPRACLSLAWSLIGKKTNPQRVKLAGAPR